MVKCTDENFEEWKPKIEEEIANSCFVAIDFEFFGLDNSQISLFDTPAERYKILRSTVMKYHPCQLGISCYHQDRSTKRFKADIFSIPLLQRHGRPETFISFDAIHFLQNNNFDVDKIFKEGVRYSNRKDFETFEENLKNGKVSSVLKRKISMLKIAIHEKCCQVLQESEEEDEIELVNVNIDSIVHENDIFVKCNSSENKRLKKLDSCDISIIIHQLTVWKENLLFSYDETLEGIIISKLPDDMTPSQNLQKTEKRCLDLFRGVSCFFELMSSQKVVLVGHNCLLDTMYIFHHFFRALPENYLDFKRQLHEMFPIIIDSKIVANSVKDVLQKQQIPNFSLEVLGDFFETDASDRLIPLEIRTIYEWKIFNDSSSNSYHDAGFDAFVTGEIFLKLAHIYINQNSKAKEVVRFRRILEYLHCDIINRLPFTLIDVGSCNLSESEDQIGNRPDSIKVCKKNEGMISVQDFDEVKMKLNWLLDEYKFCARLVENNRCIEIFTNTAPTYAFVCDIFSNKKNYILLDELYSGTKLSYEQRLTSCRSKKDEDNVGIRKVSSYGVRREQIVQMEIAMSDIALGDEDQHFSAKFEKPILATCFAICVFSCLLVRKIWFS